MSLPSVLVLAGGPDAERAISLESGAAVARALREAGHAVEYREIDGLDGSALDAMPGDVVFPVLHGLWGEGGPLQSVLEAARERTGRGYIGCGPSASRLAMDKLATKIAAGRAGVRTPLAGVVDPRDASCCVPLPVVVKPVHEGSSVGLMICRDLEAWVTARELVAADSQTARVYMAEVMVSGREVTVSLVEDGDGGFLDLPLVEIIASGGVYDYDAKYTRGDTRYVVEPGLPDGLADETREAAIRLARGIGVRDLSRVDFLIDGEGVAWLLELNTMPGFTASSLLPKAAAARGIGLPALVSRLVSLAAARSSDGAACEKMSR